MLLRNIILAVVFASLAGCEDVPATATPKPDVAPVRVSNEKTRKNITAIHAPLKSSQEHSKAEGDHLQTVDEDLAKLLRWIWIE